MIKIAKVILFSLVIILLMTFIIKFNKRINIKNIKLDLDKELRENYPKEDSVYGTIEIPSLKTKVKLYKGSDELLKYGALHHRETNFPGEGKPILISSSSKYIKNLDKLKENDEIYIKTVYGDYKYKVVKTRIRKQEKIEKDLNQKSELLILYTDLNETERIVVYAK